MKLELCRHTCRRGDQNHIDLDNSAKYWFHLKFENITHKTFEKMKLMLTNNT